MSLRIEVDRIACTTSPHTAWRISAPDNPQCWRVTWLPGRRLTRNQAVTAMTLAEVLASGTHPDKVATAQLGAWAAELGLNPTEVTDHLHRTSARR
jgi:hypothetical protein